MKKWAWKYSLYENYDEKKIYLLGGNIVDNLNTMLIFNFNKIEWDCEWKF